ncbi:MAG: hypothetical protein Q8O67_05325 [Deltaproteobacteria bacterium]|nr:hypothetical protein [Deltaproteobacteria bacterium]
MTESEDELLERLITGTDVYIKYGLREKALEQVDKMLAIRPTYAPALERQQQLATAPPQTPPRRIALPPTTPPAAMVEICPGCSTPQLRSGLRFCTECSYDLAAARAALVVDVVVDDPSPSLEQIKAASDVDALARRFGPAGVAALLQTAVAERVWSLRIVEKGPWFWVRGKHRHYHYGTTDGTRDAPPWDPGMGFEEPPRVGPVEEEREYLCRGDDVVPYTHHWSQFADVIAASLVDVVAQSAEVLALAADLGAAVLATREQAIHVVERPSRPALFWDVGSGYMALPYTSAEPFDPLADFRPGPAVAATTAPEVLADPLVSRFEPPHFEGRVFVFLVDVYEDGVRVSVDADTLKVGLEQMGSYRAKPKEDPPGYQRIPGGRGYVDAAGGLITAEHSAAHRSSSSSLAARQWVTQGLFEHASVASFARSTLELMAHGAPLELIRRTAQAALDEVRHAEQCFAIARRLDDVDVVIGPLEALAPRSGTLRELAERTRSEAAIPESLFAAEALAAAERCDDDVIRAVLLEQARDEAEHAALAWDIVRWADDDDDFRP